MNPAQPFYPTSPGYWGWLYAAGVKAAVAEIRGGPLAPGIRGAVWFHEAPGGTWVSAYITGLPGYQPAKPGQSPVGPFGFHLHESGNCETGDPANPFSAAGGHWNPTGQPHGNHAGDFPVLFSNHGVSILSFFTDRFQVDDIVGRSVIIHEYPDDYRSQPAGNAGRRLACGTIVACP